MKIKFKIMLLLFLGITIANAQTKKKQTAKKATNQAIAKVDNPNDGIFAEIETTKGKILLKLEYKKTPVTVANFISLAEGTNPKVSETYKGKKFYDGLKFHRVIKDFMIQGGDPLGNGSGGPGYAFKDEITDLKHDKSGILSMANSGPKTNGSQFFITHKETPHLNGVHTVFGSVVTGMEVVNAIEQNVRKGDAATKFNAPKVFEDYFINKAAEEAKEAAAKAAATALLLKEFDEKGKTTATGIKYIVLKEGTGANPTATSNVKVHYTGTFLDGKVFDSSVQRGEPIDFGLNQVIEGWKEGVQLMKEGAKYKFFIPSKLAYGERGAGGVIPPNTDLLFDVELLKINN
jgi:peptidyl-prolyl cis-trans isomerase A (cyclophilin A)